MDARPDKDPPFALKVATVVGVVTLVVGLVGAVYLSWLREDSDSPSAPVAVVKLTNVPTDAALQVTATWSEGEQSRSEDAHAGTEEGIWAFHLAPIRESLTLTIWRVKDGTRRILVQRSVALDRLEPVVVQLPHQ